MIASTLVAATLAAAQPQPQPAPAMDHRGMAMPMGKGDAKPAAAMDCCKDGCACCAKDKTKPAS